MQTLSSMRRNSTYHRVIVPFGLFVLAIIYASISSMSLYLTPLLGVGFYYIIKHIHDKNRYFDFFLIALYSLYIEIDRGLVLFSFILFTILFYILVFRTFKNLFIVKYVWLLYILVLAILGTLCLIYFLLML
jgi:hypothetical protein